MRVETIRQSYSLTWWDFKNSCHKTSYDHENRSALHHFERRKNKVGRGVMDCPHCGKAFHDRWTDVDIQQSGHDGVTIKWVAGGTICPASGNSTFDLRKFHLGRVLTN